MWLRECYYSVFVFGYVVSGLIRGQMEQLYSKIIPIDDLQPHSIHAMYGLYANYYANTNLAAFQKDLFQKNTVLQIYNEQSTLIGFTTILHYQIHYLGQPIQIMYSGDTIMADYYWGRPILAFSWLKFAGQVKAKHPTHPLYWFIIVKGHRTYRYLPVFSKLFYPNHQYETPIFEQSLIDHLATTTFGEHYKPELGIVHFPESKGHLKQCWADIPAKLLNRKDIQFFKNKNPQYHQGDELVCLCQLDEANLKPLARRLFNQGFLRHHEEHAVI